MKLNKLWLIILLPILIVLVLWLYIVIKPAFQEARLQASLRVYPNAALVGSDSAVWGSDMAQRNVFYASSDPINDVKTYYEGVFNTFHDSRDEYGSWWMTAFDAQGLSLGIVPNSDYLHYDSFCDHDQTYACITISLIDLQQSDVHRLGISSPSSFRYTTPPAFFETLDGDGTLVIYSYLISDY
jgi:hypothetical protein